MTAQELVVELAKYPDFEVALADWNEGYANPSVWVLDNKPIYVIGNVVILGGDPDFDTMVNR